MKVEYTYHSSEDTEPDISIQNDLGQARFAFLKLAMMRNLMPSMLGTNCRNFFEQVLKNLSFKNSDVGTGIV